MNDQLLEEIEKALDNIRPYLHADGGDVKVLRLENDETLVIELLGNCVSCPMSSMTLKAGVEESIIRSVPQIKKVTAVNVMPLENQPNSTATI
ncbi:MAG: Fe-S cluster biogenesis protein NfuA [Cyclobacteriaceae bacterium]|jgi:Fe-S cluster biogenesis protein NfuA